MPRKPAVQSQFDRTANKQRQVSGEKCERELDSVRQEKAVGHVHGNHPDCHDAGQQQGRIASQQSNEQCGPTDELNNGDRECPCMTWNKTELLVVSTGTLQSEIYQSS